MFGLLQFSLLPQRLDIVVASFGPQASPPSEKDCSRRCSSSPHETRFAGLSWGPQMDPQVDEAGGVAPRRADPSGGPLCLKCSAEMNSACAKVLLAQNACAAHLRRPRFAGQDDAGLLQFPLLPEGLDGVGQTPQVDEAGGAAPHRAGPMGTPCV